MPSIQLRLMLLIVGALIPWPAASQEAASRAVLNGRWNLTLQTPQGSYQTPVEFVVGSGGKVVATILGPLGSFRISDAEGTLVGDRVRLSARSSFGSLRVDAKLVGDQLRGRWLPAGLLSRLFFRGELRGSRDNYQVRVPRVQVYRQIWDLLERHFYALDYNGVDIAGLRARYLPQIVGSESDGQFLALVRKMLGEFRSSHLDFYATPSPDLRDQQPAPDDSTHGISWRQLSPTIGYLRIRSFEDGDAVVERLDRAFSELRRAEGLVIDVRENGGGSLSAAMRLGDHIFPELKSVGYFVSREGLIRHRAGSIDQINPATIPIFTGYASAELAREMGSSGAAMLATGGRAPAPRGPGSPQGAIVLLVDEYCFSACEALASVAKEKSAATLVGRRTAGAMLGALPIQVDGGWTLELPVWDFRTPEGVQVEGRGVEPHFVVQRGRRDADLVTALRYLRRARGRERDPAGRGQAGPTR